MLGYWLIKFRSLLIERRLFVILFFNAAAYDVLRHEISLSMAASSFLNESVKPPNCPFFEGLATSISHPDFQLRITGLWKMESVDLMLPRKGTLMVALAWACGAGAMTLGRIFFVSWRSEEHELCTSKARTSISRRFLFMRKMDKGKRFNYAV